MADKLKAAYVKINLCIGCEVCVEECPAGAISLNDDGKAVVDREKCLNKICQWPCMTSCPVGAIRRED